MDFKINISEIELLSEAKLYKNIPKIILLEDMVTRDEDLLLSNTNLASGEVFKELVNRKVKNDFFKADDLLIGDFNQLLIKLRISGYGHEYTIKVYDEDIDDYRDEVIDLRKLQDKKLLDEFNEEGEFSLVLPKSQCDVNFILTTVGMADVINKHAEKRKDLKTGTIPYLTTKLEYLITNVNGETNKEYIKNFINVMSPIDRLALTKKINEVEPNILLKWEYETSVNKKKVETDFMLGIDFFYVQ